MIYAWSYLSMNLTLRKISQSQNTETENNTDIKRKRSYQQTSLCKSCGDGVLPRFANTTQDDVLVWCETYIQIILLYYFP